MTTLSCFRGAYQGQLTAPENRLEERDQIVKDLFAWEDLRFILTPVDDSFSSAYNYYSNAGQDMTIIALDDRRLGGEKGESQEGLILQSYRCI